jgi:hypothetical protein
MYFKDYLKDLLKDAQSYVYPIPLIPIPRTVESKCVSYSVNMTKLVSRGALLSCVHALADETLKQKIKYVVLEFQGHVMDVAKDDDYEFPAFSNYPFPIYELKLCDENNIPNVFHLHFFSEESWGEVDVAQFQLQGQFSIPNDLKYIDRIPQEWGLSLEPSWNEMKLKIEKKNGNVFISESPGWIPLQKWTDYFLLGKEDGESNEDEKMNDFIGYIPEPELSTELTTAKYLGLFPLDDNQKIHTYMQWRSLRTNIQNKLDTL